MKKFIVVGALLGMSASFSVVNAAEVPSTSLTKVCKPLVNKNLKTPQPPIRGIDERTHKRITRAQEKMAEGNYPEGIEILKKLAASAKSDYIKATVNIQLAYAVAQQGKQLDSLPYFKNALRFGENNLPHDRVQQIRENVAGLMYSIGEKKEGVKLMEEWMKKSNVDKANAYYLLSAMYADPDIGRTKDALCPAYFATQTEKAPKKSYFQLLLALHWELKDVIGSANMLKKMVEYFPTEKSFWRQLSQIYMQLDKTKESLAIMEMFYLKGNFETETDYKFMSQLFSFEQIPYRAAQIMEEGLKKGVVKPEEKNWKAVATNYHVSNELKKAIVAYGKTAEIAKDGESFLRQAELYGDLENWGSAVTAYDKALQKGGLDDAGRAIFGKGVALVNMGRCDSAFAVFDRASKYKNYRKRSIQWTSFAKDRKKHKKC
ncbi:tetratricopeptide repeat protein [Aliikangiella coralliicola]|uniref:Tetratricopeptide repeat protein n=1 Tax=Aliikangiella coralliicola TaxID=2592383 RepID=A0A545UAW6_9GAMM|nr:tetratricopeptide repeat protein [Aliikangiella coralliicola]TQV86598.1 tetratricopeptide repeat protein [Aliikangiella coralliicola]